VHRLRHGGALLARPRPPESLEHLVEGPEVFLPRHEHRPQRVVDVVPSRQSDFCQRTESVRHAAGADGNARPAQGAREQDHVRDKMS
jgi:hypothetical protein